MALKTISLGSMKKEDGPLHCLIYGQAGAGKTHLMRGFPKPMLIFDFDQKYDPLIGVEGIEVISYKMAKPEDAAAIIPQFWRDWQQAKRSSDYATLVFDSVTALDRVLERWAVASSGKGKGADARATIQEYGDMGRWYKTFFPSLRTATDKNVIVLAHEQPKEDDGVLINIRPYITGKIGDVLPSIFPNTFQLEHIVGGRERRVIHIKKHGKYVCCSSTLSLDKIEYTGDENGYDKLMEAIKKSS